MRIRGPLDEMLGGLFYFNFKVIDWAQSKVAYFLLEYHLKSII